MNEIDQIKPSEDTLMTDDLIRIFKSLGCSPTVCHACRKEIKTGEVFKLVPHTNIDSKGHDIEGFSDEMCCDKCDDHQLTLRDLRYRKKYKSERVLKIAAGGHGFSRPSKS